MTSLIDLEPAAWSEKQFGTCDLGDVRRTQRLVRYAQQMAEKPDASTPHQTEDWADCKAVYRLFERPEVTFEAVTDAHYQNTRTLPPGRYLVISDTTEIDYGYKSERKGPGPLTARHRRGFFLHSALIVDAQSHQVMGLGMQELWARAAGKRDRVHRVNCRKRPTESEVWGRVIDEVNGLGPGIQFIHVCDRGADNFDVFAQLYLKGDSWVIRAAQLKRKLRTADGTVLKLDEVLAAATLKGSYEIWVSANKNQKARWAHVEVRSASVTMLRPREGATAFVMDNEVREVPTNIVEVREVKAPKGSAALRWVLYAHESVASFEDCIRVVEHYEQRPVVEEYHKCLKTGLQVEGRQYKTSDRLELLRDAGVRGVPLTHFHFLAVTSDHQLDFSTNMSPEIRPLFLDQEGKDFWEQIASRVGWLGFSAIDLTPLNGLLAASYRQALGTMLQSEPRTHSSVSTAKPPRDQSMTKIVSYNTAL